MFIVGGLPASVELLRLKYLIFMPGNWHAPLLLLLDLILESLLGAVFICPVSWSSLILDKFSVFQFKRPFSLICPLL